MSQLVVTPKFPLGQTLATPGALKALEESGQSPAFFLEKHVQGDWGTLGDEDKQANDQALVDGSRILSAYRTLKGERIWIITEAADDTGHASRHDRFEAIRVLTPMAKPCRNSRWLGPPRMAPDGIIERPFELLPDYGRNSLYARIIDGYDPDTQNDQYEIVFHVPSPELRRKLTDPNDPECPLSRFVGNAGAKERLSRAAYAAWGRDNHCCADHSFALLGPSSVGKTTLARLFGETLRLPFMEVQPHAVRDARDLFRLIYNKLEETVIQFKDGPKSLKMVSTLEDPVWRVSPCVVFLDEVHALPKNLIPELLKAVEPKDGMLIAGNG